MKRAVEDFLYKDSRMWARTTVLPDDDPAVAEHPDRFEDYDEEAARALVRQRAQNPRNCVAIDGEPSSHNRKGHHSMANTRTATNSPGHEAREKAQRAIDAAFERGDLPEAAGFMLTDLVERDKFGIDSGYVEAVADPAYERAFAKKLTGVDGAEGVLEADEAEAMQTVGRAMATRAMAVGEGSTGGYAVPLTLDPTVLLTNDGAVNPIRELATVTQIATTHWIGVSSAGVKAEFAKEATEASDASPELGQPEITPERASIWVPYSFETAQDWPGLATELGKLFADAKQVKEAETFAVGAGENNIPEGLITGATKTVTTAGSKSMAVADIYSLQEALAPRWQPRATWLGANTVANEIHQMVAAADPEHAPLMSEDRTSILGKPYREVSTMSAKTTTEKELVLAYGDISSAYRIVDRIGMFVEPVQHVFGEEGAPTGQRGLFAWFRVGAKVVIPDALQVLKIKA